MGLTSARNKSFFKDSHMYHIPAHFNATGIRNSTLILPWMCIKTFLGSTLQTQVCVLPGKVPQQLTSLGHSRPNIGERKLFGNKYAPCQWLASRRELIIFKLLPKHLLVDTRAKRTLWLRLLCRNSGAAFYDCRAAHRKLISSNYLCSGQRT